MSRNDDRTSRFHGVMRQIGYTAMGVGSAAAAVYGLTQVVRKRDLRALWSLDPRAAPHMSVQEQLRIGADNDGRDDEFPPKRCRRTIRDATTERYEVMEEMQRAMRSNDMARIQRLSRRLNDLDAEIQAVPSDRVRRERGGAPTPDRAPLVGVSEAVYPSWQASSTAMMPANAISATNTTTTHRLVIAHTPCCRTRRSEGRMMRRCASRKGAPGLSTARRPAIVCATNHRAATLIGHPQGHPPTALTGGRPATLKPQGGLMHRPSMRPQGGLQRRPTLRPQGGLPRRPSCRSTTW